MVLIDYRTSQWELMFTLLFAHIFLVFTDKLSRILVFAGFEILIVL